jgi:hypothetical protein
MTDILPEGEDLRRAVKWISGNLKDDPDRPVQPLIEEAIFKFDLSPKDGEFLTNFYREASKKK